MKVRILSSFEAYPNGKRITFKEGDTLEIDDAFAAEADLIAKGLVEEVKDKPAKAKSE